MKATAYIRVSTEKQSYDRQLYSFNEYFKNKGIDPAGVEIVSEKITSYTTFKERAIYQVLKNANPGEVIYVCQLDRLGRTVEDIIQLVKFADKKGVELITIKDGQRVTNETQTGKMILTLLAMVAEMERELRAERCQAGYEAMKQELKEKGFRIARVSGKMQTRIGNPKGTDMSAANEASCKSKIDAMIEWRENSVAYKWVMSKLAAQVPRKEIIEEFNRLHELQPEVFCTRTGKPLTKALLSHWATSANPLTL